MRPSPLSCLAVGLALAMASTNASAQGPPGRQSLIVQESVQEDLGLSDKQKSTINSLQASIGQKSRDAFQSLQENGAEPQEFQQAMAGVYREHQASLARVLDKTQKARLAQIELQREGFLAASRSEIASKLKLAPAQTKKIKTIIDEMRQAQARAMPGLLGGLQPTGPGATPPASGKAAGTSKTKKGSSKNRRPSQATEGNGEMGMGMEGESAEGEMPGFNLQGFVSPTGLPDFLKPENQPDFAKLAEVQKTTRDEASVKIGEVLTAEQKTAFEKLTGKPFDLSKIQAASAEPKPGEEATPKADEATKKDAPAKTSAKTKTKKGGK